MASRPPISNFKRASARRLRGNATNAETILWRHLRRLETRGTHFRRQVPLGNYIVDFACLAAHLVIEVDGSQHGEGPGLIRDRERTRWLEGEGYRVLRLWNNDVVRNSRGVLEAIYEALYGASDGEVIAMKHERTPRSSVHPTPARSARRPSPSRGG
ncbi:MAG: endonuclease domain-containing protein [Proteobacteria bacterium]|nr:endonuclease domain-containing protein [Pseudomonadota bacterium]